jgi:hypothetical protein
MTCESYMGAAFIPHPMISEVEPSLGLDPITDGCEQNPG